MRATGASSPIALTQASVAERPNRAPACSVRKRQMLEAFIDRLTCRSFLSDRERELILDLPFRVRQVRANQTCGASAARADHVTYVMYGMIGRFGQNSRGETQITALHIEGDMADLHSVVQPTATSALMALSTSTIMEVPHASLRHVSGANPAIAEAFWRDCMVDSMVLAQWVVNVGRRDARSGIAHLLCEMACRYKAARVDGTVQFRLPMTQYHLADATGLATVHVSRTLKGLAAIGTTFKHKWVRIEDWDALVAAADFDRSYLQEDLAPEGRIRLVQ